MASSRDARRSAIGLYLVRVHDAPRNVTVPVAHHASEYRVEAPSLALACELVFDKPVRVAPPVSRDPLQVPGHRDYVAPDRALFHAVADFTRGDRASLGAALHRADAELAIRAARAVALGTREATADGATVVETASCVDSWDDPSADHAAELRAYVETEWADEEVAGRSWHHVLHAALAKVGVDGPVERGLAEEAYWDRAREVIAEQRSREFGSPAPGM